LDPTLSPWSALDVGPLPSEPLIDLGCERPSSWIEWAVEDARRRRSGVRAIRAVLEVAGGPAVTRSEAEARLVRLLRKAGLAPEETDARVEG
jgi:hypothetical protein